jgi:uncharacterized protein YndB with AHSA1/START domain
MEPIESRSDIRSRLLAASPAEVFEAMSDPARIARWWGPAGFTNTIHQFEFRPGGTWLLTMHGPDGKNYPNESRFTRVVANQMFEIEHLNGHHFLLTIELEPRKDGTQVKWRQTFDSIEHYQRIADFVAKANEENLDRLAAEVQREKSVVPQASSWPALAQSGGLPGPVLALARFIASSPHATGLFPAVQNGVLWIARTADFTRGDGELQVGFDASAQELTFMYVPRSSEQRGWSRSCSADEGIATFERILHKRLRWLHEG